MPTATFYHLPKEKREKLMDAIYAEILRVPYEKISINQIVQTAGISRGSFYQYFQDKDDMLQMMLGSFYEKLRTMCELSLKKHNGDPFGVISDGLDLFCWVCEKEELRRLYQHLLSGLKIIDDRFNCQRMGLPCEEKSDIVSLIDLSALDIRNETDLYDMAEMLLDLLKWAFSELMAHPEKKETIRARFHNKLRILRLGMAAKQEEK